MIPAPSLGEKIQSNDPEDPAFASALLVSRDSRPMNPILIVGGFATVALMLFLWLNAHRTPSSTGLISVSAAPSQWDSSPPPPLDLGLTKISTGTGSGPFTGLPVQVGMPPPLSPPQPTQGMISAGGRPYSPSSIDIVARARAPTVVIDLGVPPAGPQVLAQVNSGSGTPSAGGASVQSAESNPAKGSPLNDSEQFADRVGNAEPEASRATSMRNPSALAPQGTIIPGVLETAINSDLPGFTRAVVSRDVLSFDGKAVLIPRGSRLIGQYKSAVSLGQSRAFIIWTRVIRPDGVSIQIGSPGTDDLGRGGLEGSVDRHFFQRFGGSILLSVLNAAVTAVGNRPSTQISIGSPTAALGAAGSALQGEKISPTIKITQGEAIRIFVARDLDFSSVEPMR